MAQSTTPSSSAGQAQEPLVAVVAVVALPTPASGSHAAGSASAASTAASNAAAAAAATTAATTVAGGAAGAGGTAKLGRTSSVGKSSSSSHLPQLSETLGGGAAAGAPPILPLTRAADSTGSFGSLQLGGTRVSSAPPVGSGGGGKGAGVAGATGGSGGGLGGLVPRKDRLLNILGQNKFTPRKDYPPSSMLFQVCACVLVCLPSRVLACTSPGWFLAKVWLSRPSSPLHFTLLPVVGVALRVRGLVVPVLCLLDRTV